MGKREHLAAIQLIRLRALKSGGLGKAASSLQSNNLDRIPKETPEHYAEPEEGDA